MDPFERDPRFYAELKELNSEILRVIESNNKKSLYFDYSDTFKDYIKSVEKIRSDYPSIDKQNNIGGALNSTTSNNTTTATDNNLGHNQSLFSSSLASNSTIRSNNLFNPANSTFSTTQDNHNGAETDDKNGADGDGDEDGEDAVPQPSLDLYEEPNYKYKTRCKLYERVIGGTTQYTLLGCGELYIKDLDTPGKLHLIVRRDPDLRTIILNQVITSKTPLKTMAKAVQIFVPGADGKSTCYIAKVKDEQVVTELCQQLKEVKKI